MRWFARLQTPLAVAAAARIAVAFGLLGSLPLQSDARSYAEEGARLAAAFPGAVPFFWPPGLPLVLAGAYKLLGDELWVSRAVAVALGVANVALAMVVANRVSGSEAVVRATGWIAALYPPALLMAGQTYSQLLATTCLLGTAIAVLRVARDARLTAALAGGLTLGFGALTRPSMLSIGPPLALVALLAAMRAWRRRMRTQARRLALAAVLGTIGVAACVIPVAAFHASLGAGWSLSTNNEANFFLGNNPYTPLYKTSHLAQRPLSALEPDARAYLERFYRAPDPRSAMFAESLRYVADHPFATTWRTLSRIRAFWGFDYLMSRAIHVQLGWNAPAILLSHLFEAGGYALVMLAVLAGLSEVLRGRPRAPRLLLLLLVAAYQAPYAIAFSSGTYHYAVMGLLFPFAGVAVAAARAGAPPWRDVRTRRWLARAVVVFALVQVEYAYHTLRLAPAAALRINPPPRNNARGDPGIDDLDPTRARVLPSEPLGSRLSTPSPRNSER